MQLGMVGLGRMGANIVRRLHRDGHHPVGYDVDAGAVAAIEADGVAGASTLEALMAALDRPRHVWIMVPAGITGWVIDQVAEHVEEGDTLIDGGNSNYIDAIAKAAELAERGIHLVDVGTSGGVFGLDRGYCLMIGGADEPVERLDPIFRSLAPGVGAAERTTGRSGEATREEHGYLHCGPSGAGHFVKMVHNGIEYGMMAAYAEGLNVLDRAGIGRSDQHRDAETTPLRHPEHYQYDIDIARVTEVWRRGSVIGSWLLDLTAAALRLDQHLDGFEGRVSDSGEGRWTVQAAIDEGVPTPVLAAALHSRFASRDNDEFANKVLSAMRFGFGGHLESSD